MDCVEREAIQYHFTLRSSQLTKITSNTRYVILQEVAKKPSITSKELKASFALVMISICAYQQQTVIVYLAGLKGKSQTLQKEHCCSIIVGKRPCG